MGKFRNILKLLRLKHCIKNFLVFVPLIFMRDEGGGQRILYVLIGFISFSLIASTIYIINDAKDVEKDKLHPTKKNRPFASGKISIAEGFVYAVCCFFISIGLLSYLIVFHHVSFFALFNLLLYFILNLAYSLGLKNIPIIDITILTAGFLIRVMFGAILAGTYVSSWLYLTIVSAAFYLGLGKRRNEIKMVEGGIDGATRSVLQKYTLNFLDKFMYLCLGMTCVFYALWAKEYPNPYMILTVPVVIIIFMQYSLDIESSYDGDPVEVVFADKKILAFCLLFLCMLFGIIYLL